MFWIMYGNQMSKSTFKIDTIKILTPQLHTVNSFNLG